MASPESQAKEFVATVVQKSFEFITKVKRIDGDDNRCYDQFVAFLNSTRKGLIGDDETARKRVAVIFKNHPKLLEEFYNVTKIGQDYPSLGINPNCTFGNQERVVIKKKIDETCDASHNITFEKLDVPKRVGVFDPKGKKERATRETLIKIETEKILRPLIAATENVKRLIEAMEDPKRSSRDQVICIEDYLTATDLMCIRKLRDCGLELIKKIKSNPSLSVLNDTLSCLRKSKSKSVDRLYELSLNV